MMDIHCYVEKSRKAGKYLKLIKHSQECKAPNCRIPQCDSTKQLLKHCIPCVNKSCNIAGCYQTMSLLRHANACELERKHARQYGIVPKLCLICYSCNRSNNSTSESTYPSEPVFGEDGFAIPLPPKRLRRDTVDSFENCKAITRTTTRGRFSSI